MLSKIAAMVAVGPPAVGVVRDNTDFGVNTELCVPHLEWMLCVISHSLSWKACLVSYMEGLSGVLPGVALQMSIALCVCGNVNLLLLIYHSCIMG